MMGRREFITLIGSAISLPASIGCAQAQSKLLRVGTANALARARPQFQAFERRMAELGYRDGTNFILDYEQIPSVSEAEYRAGYSRLLERGVDIIVTGGPEISLKGAMAVAGKRPIVMVAIDYDPLTGGYVKSLAQPGGNVTGVFLEQIELAEKRVQVLQDAFPDLTAALAFWDAQSADQWRATEQGAQKLAFKLAGIEFKDEPYNYEQALAQSPPDHRGALIVMTSPTFQHDHMRIAQFAIAHRIRTMSPTREFVDGGCLLSYGANLASMYARAADYVDRIVKGANPADIPIEQPTKFELVINQKTAKALGISVPPTLVARADDVIE
jgi:putative tryptophan/tyrosine transport system substrate-binding protein